MFKNLNYVISLNKTENIIFSFHIESVLDSFVAF